MFGEIINIIWEFGSLGLLGWTGGDDDEEKKDVLLNTILFSPVQGTPFLGNFAKANIRRSRVSTDDVVGRVVRFV